MPKPIEVEYSLRFKNLRRIDPSNVEATHRFDFDADYDLKIGLPGQRAKDAAPVTLGLWVDGKLAHTSRSRRSLPGSCTSTRTPRNGFACPCRKAITRFVSDSWTIPFVKTLAKEEIYKDTVNKWIGSVTVVGPFVSEGEKPSRKRILVCNPASGARLCRSDPRDRGAARLPQAGDRPRRSRR